MDAELKSSDRLFGKETEELIEALFLYKRNTQTRAEDDFLEKCLVNWYNLLELGKDLEEEKELLIFRNKVAEQNNTDLKLKMRDLKKQNQKLLNGLGAFEQLKELSEKLIQVSQEFVNGHMHDELANISNQITVSNQALLSTYNLGTNQIRGDIKVLKRELLNKTSISTTENAPDDAQPESEAAKRQRTA